MPRRRAGRARFSILAKKVLAGACVEVWDRNPPGATYGFGVVFSDEAMEAIRRADEVVHDGIVSGRAHWGEIDVHLRGRVYTSGGHGFSALSRSALVTLMQRRATGLGVALHYETDAPDTDQLSDFDLVVGTVSTPPFATGTPTSSGHRSRRARASSSGWPRTAYDAFKFFILDTPAGVVQVHAYPYDENESTFIVEMRTDVWRQLGFERFADTAQRPGTATGRASRS